MEQIAEEALEQQPKRRGRPRTRGITTQMNVRVDRDLKVRGDEILRAVGSNPTDIISRLWGYVVRTGSVPDLLTDLDKEDLAREQERLIQGIGDVRGMPWRVLESEASIASDRKHTLSISDVRAMCDDGEALRAREVAKV